MEEQTEPQFTEEEQFVNTDPEELLGENPDKQKVSVGLHPLGGVAIAVTGPDGTEAVARLDLEQAWTVIGHLSAITSMFISTAYAAAAQEQAAQQQLRQKIVLPR